MKKKLYNSVIYKPWYFSEHLVLPLFENSYFYQYGKLAENYIEKYKNELWWDMIAKYQPLSNKMIAKYKDKLNLYFLEKNEKVDKVFIEKLKLLK